MGKRQDKKSERNIHGRLNDYMETFTIENVFIYSKGDKKHLCPFCETPHTGFPLFIAKAGVAPIDISPEVLIVSMAHACQECSEPIYDAERTLFGDNLRDQTSFVMSENHLITEKLKVDEFARFGKFEEGVIKYHTSPYPPQPADGVDFPNHGRCYFCDGVESILPQSIKAPITSFVTLNAASIMCCKSCEGRILRKCAVTNNIYEITNLKSCIDKCAICVKPFPVTPDEYQYRFVNGSLQQHMCPNCLYQHKSGGRNRFQRYVADKTCIYCEIDIPVDTTLAPKFRPIIGNCCENCKYDGQEPLYYQKIGEVSYYFFRAAIGSEEVLRKRIVSPKGKAMVISRQPLWEEVLTLNLLNHMPTIM